jgi:hypothetical protein
MNGIDKYYSCIITPMQQPKNTLIPSIPKDISFVKMKSMFVLLQLMKIVCIIIVVKLATLKPSTICYRDSNIGTFVQFWMVYMHGLKDMIGCQLIHCDKIKQTLWPYQMQAS